MREIKFRSWHKFYKQMVEVDWIQLIPDETYHRYKIGFSGRLDRILNQKVADYATENEIELLQYTGLKDRHGNDIYEGDILGQYPGFGCEWESRIGMVKYNYASFWFEFKSQGIILDDHDCSFEIIGNIYENPELIKTMI